MLHPPSPVACLADSHGSIPLWSLSLLHRRPLLRVLLPLHGLALVVPPIGPPPPTESSPPRSVEMADHRPLHCHTHVPWFTDVRMRPGSRQPTRTHLLTHPPTHPPTHFIAPQSQRSHRLPRPLSPLGQATAIVLPMGPALICRASAWYVRLHRAWSPSSPSCPPLASPPTPLPRPALRHGRLRLAARRRLGQW